uniref:Peptide-methionine (R)-S-oxide reductase n=1 Tax=Prymnesium polylepis TaxID=72548 RepID=A0A6V4LXA9_9EUKA
MLAVTICSVAVALPRRAVTVQGGAALATAFLATRAQPALADGPLLPKTGGPVVLCEEDVMSQKAHGTTDQPVQQSLRWNVDRKNADRICSFNRHYAEYAGYWKTTSYLKEVSKDEPTVYYDSVTGKPLFVAPIGRTMQEFLAESDVHGWPSFRDEEVVWENMRVLRTTGETVSKDGTHLGHNLPDRKGNRYCINLISVAGLPVEM